MSKLSYYVQTEFQLTLLKQLKRMCVHHFFYLRTFAIFVFVLVCLFTYFDSPLFGGGGCGGGGGEG